MLAGVLLTPATRHPLDRQKANQDIYGRLLLVNLMRESVCGHIFGVVMESGMLTPRLDEIRPPRPRQALGV
jgi:hypothetical protein